MKKTLLILAALLFQLNSFAQYTAIPDVNFEQALIDKGIDSGGIDHKVLTANINKITYLIVSNYTIADLTGIEDFVALQTLNCDTNQLTSLNVGGLSALTALSCSNNQLTSLNVGGLTDLTYLACKNNRLTSLNVSGLMALTNLLCDDNQLTNLNMSGLSALKQLNCSYNQLTSLNVSGFTALTYLGCGGNQLTSLNVSGSTALRSLECDSNQLTSLNVSGLTALTYLYCVSNQLNSLDMSGLTALTSLGCSYNQLTCLNVSGLKALTYFGCTFNPSLSCIQVDNVAAATANGNWQKDATASYSTNCSLSTSTFNQKTFSLSPNPVKSILNLQFSTAITIDQIIITDLTGKTVLQQTPPESERRTGEANINQINVEQLANGIYILQAFSGKEKIQSKFVKE